jgi:hypothetical protein
VVEWRVRFTSTPIFNSLNTGTFWLEFYDNWTRDEMMNQARVLGIHTWKTISTAMVKSKLMRYWIARMNNETFDPAAL